MTDRLPVAAPTIQQPAILQLKGEPPCFGMIASLSEQGLAFDFQASAPESHSVGSKARLDFDFQDQHFSCDSLLVHIHGQRALLALKEAPAPILAALHAMTRQNTPNLASGLSMLQIQHACHAQFMAHMKTVLDAFYRLLPEKIEIARLQASSVNAAAELTTLDHTLNTLRPNLIREFTLAYPMYPEIRDELAAAKRTAPELELVDMAKVDDWIRRTRIAHAVEEAIGSPAEEFNRHYGALLKKARKQISHPYQAELILDLLAELLDPLELSAVTRAFVYEVMGEAFQKQAMPLYQAMLQILGKLPPESLRAPAAIPSLAQWLRESALSSTVDEDKAADHSDSPSSREGISALAALLGRLTENLGTLTEQPRYASGTPASIPHAHTPVPGLLARDRLISRFLPVLPGVSGAPAADRAPGQTPSPTPSPAAGPAWAGLQDLDNAALEGLVALMRQPPPVEPGPEKLSQASQVRALMLQAQGLLLEYTLNGLTYQAEPDHPAWLLINALDALHCGADDRGQLLDPAIHQAVSLTMQWLLGQGNADVALQQVNTLLQRITTQFRAEQQNRRTQHLAKLGPLAADPSLINTGWCIVRRSAEAIPYEVLGVHAGNWALLNRSATELLEIPAERFLRHIDEGVIEEVGSFDVPYLERIANVSLTASLDAVHAYTWQDPASGCLKRSALMDELERRLARAVTQPPTFCALIEIPTMRPSLSSLPGDELTVMQKRTGEMLLGALENGEHCGRLSDVSFMMVFVPQQPARLAERLSRLKTEVESLHAEWKMLGAAVPLADNDSAPSPSNVLRRANQACASQRQEAGLDLSCLSVPQSPIEQDSGLPFAALYLRCQKIAACVDGARSHYEILLGVDQEQVPHHTTQSMVVMAEQTGCIQELDLWVLRSSLEWMSRNAPLMDQLSGLSVNLSGASLTVPEHVDVMVDMLSAFPHLRKQLIFEVTETAAIGNLDAAVHSLRKLRRLGCRVALDDFGSGYSSYSYLRSLPLDYLKIDGTYIRDILTDKTDQALTASMVDVAHALGLKVIAEFVDSEGAYSWLKNASVDYVQGYWVHKPERLDGLSLSEPQLLLA